MATYNFSEPETNSLQEWFDAFSQQLAAAELIYQSVAERAVDVALRPGAAAAAQFLGRLNVFASAYVNHLKIQQSNEGMSSELLALKSSVAAATTTLAALGGGWLIGISLTAGIYALPLALVGVGFAYYSPQVGLAVANFLDLLADNEIAEFNGGENVILQSEHIWGTSFGDTLTATNPNIVQHLHGVDGENTMIGSDGRNYFYGGPQKDTIETGGGNNASMEIPSRIFRNFTQCVAAITRSRRATATTRFSPTKGTTRSDSETATMSCIRGSGATTFMSGRATTSSMPRRYGSVRSIIIRLARSTTGTSSITAR